MAIHIHDDRPARTITARWSRQGRPADRPAWQPLRYPVVTAHISGGQVRIATAVLGHVAVIVDGAIRCTVTSSTSRSTRADSDVRE